MTHRKLIQKALPLCSLSSAQWQVINEHLEKIRDSKLSNTIQILISNQAKIEIMGNYNDYYADKLEEALPENNSTILII